MKILLLGAGAQGKATIYDLLQNPNVEELVVVENNPAQLDGFLERLGDTDARKIVVVQADANDKDEMLGLISRADIVIDLLPTVFRKHIAELCIEAGVDLVNTSYQSHIEELANAAAMKGVRIMPEAGLDPGIDLVLAGDAVRSLDKVESFVSACGGIPVKEHCNNPLNYKVSWIFEGVLSALKRPGNLIVDGRVVDIPSGKIFDHGKVLDVDGLGKLEMTPNGYATTYAGFLGIPDVKNMGRYTLRWPGHIDFWKKIVDLGLVDDDPVLGISPKKYMAKVLEPRLQYEDHEKDLVVLYNEIKGSKDGKQVMIIQKVVDERDLATGFMAMNRTVGFTASIIAQMMLAGKITGKGILNPAKDVPAKEFVAELEKRGIKVDEKLFSVHD